MRTAPSILVTRQEISLLIDKYSLLTETAPGNPTLLYRLLGTKPALGDCVGHLIRIIEDEATAQDMSGDDVMFGFVVSVDPKAKDIAVYFVQDFSAARVRVPSDTPPGSGERDTEEEKEEWNEVYDVHIHNLQSGELDSDMLEVLPYADRSIAWYTWK